MTLRSSVPMSFPPVPADLRTKNPFRYLKFYGPGAIIASVSIGGGETIFASRGGAIFGFALIWCILLVVILKAMQVYSGMRVMTLTGNHPTHYWAQMKGPRAWFPILLSLVAFIIIAATFSALPKALATLLMQLLGRGPDSTAYVMNLNVLSSVVLVVCGLGALRSSYRTLELAQTVIVLLFLALIVASFLALRPDLWIVLKNVLVISIPEYPDWVQEKYPTIVARPNWVEVMTFAGLIGGNSSDYIAYLSFLRNKKWGLAGSIDDGAPSVDTEDESKKGKLWLRAPLTDMLLSFSLVAVLSVIFLVLGAMVLSPARLVPDASELLSVQARFLTELHPRLAPLYVVGIVTVFLGTIYGTFELQTRALFECGRVTSERLRRTSIDSVRSFVIIYGTVSGLLLIWTGWDPVAIVTPGVLVSVLASGLWCFVMLWVDRRFLPKYFQMPVGLAVGLVLAGIILVGFGLRSTYDYLAQF